MNLSSVTMPFEHNKSMQKHNTQVKHAFGEGHVLICFYYQEYHRQRICINKEKSDPMQDWASEQTS